MDDGMPTARPSRSLPLLIATQSSASYACNSLRRQPQCNTRTASGDGVVIDVHVGAAVRVDAVRVVAGRWRIDVVV